MEINKRYTSFDEIDKDLMLLKLKADICKEEIRIASKKIKKSFKPVEITQDLVSTYVRQNLTSKAIDIALNIVRNWRYRKYKF